MSRLLNLDRFCLLYIGIHPGDRSPLETWVDGGGERHLLWGALEVIYTPARIVVSTAASPAS